MSGARWQGRKGTANRAVESARPDSKARPVSVERLQAVLGSSGMSDAQAEEWLIHLSALADVAVQAFIEQRSQAAAVFADAELLTVGTDALMPTALAA